MSNAAVEALIPSVVVVDHEKLGDGSLCLMLQEYGMPVKEISLNKISTRSDELAGSLVCVVISAVDEISSVTQAVSSLKRDIKWLIIAVGDVVFELKKEVDEYELMLEAESAKVIELSRNLGVDVRWVTVYGAGGGGFGVGSRDWVIRSLGEGAGKIETSSQFMPISMKNLSRSLVSVWFDRGHKHARLRVCAKNSLPIEKLEKSLNSDYVTHRLVEWGSGANLVGWEIVEQDAVDLQQVISEVKQSTDREIKSYQSTQKTILPFQSVVVEEVNVQSLKENRIKRIHQSNEVYTKPQLQKIQPITPQVAVEVVKPQNSEEKFAKPAAREPVLPSKLIHTPQVPNESFASRFDAVSSVKQSELLKTVEIKRRLERPIKKTITKTNFPKTPRRTVLILIPGIVVVLFAAWIAVPIYKAFRITPNDDVIQNEKYQILTQDLSSQLSLLPVDRVPGAKPILQAAVSRLENQTMRLMKYQADNYYVAAMKRMLTAGEGDPYELLSAAKLAYEDVYVYQTLHVNPSQVNEKLSARRQMVSLLPYLLPGDRKSTVLMLLQNNLELRPTGGFIGAVALLTFDHGKMINMEIRDIYDLDSNLKGAVKPPAEVLTYLGESNWFFRDSNWDPEFRRSAETANWFLDKERGGRADVVVALNLNTIKTILDESGPLTLPNGQILTAENLYISAFNHQDAPVVKPESQKQEFISMLIKPIVDRITQSSVEQSEKVLTALEASLIQRDMLLASNNKVAGVVIDGAEWGGEIEPPECSPISATPCFSDAFLVSEANVGINKANYYVARERQHNLVVKENSVDETAILTYANNSPSDQWPAGVYKAYVRMYVPASAVIGDLTVDNQAVPRDSIVQLKIGSMVQLGTYIEVKPQTKKTVSLKYQIPLSGAGTYQLTIKKQPGQMPDNLTVTAQLVSGSVSKINSSLVKDIQERWVGKLDRDHTVTVELSR